MARLKTAVELEMERQELAKYAQGNYVMDKARLLLPYARQSTDRQYFKSMMDNTEQSSELLEHARALDWPLDKILPVFVENDGSKKTSGTISIDDRPKIKEARALINAGKVSAVLVIDVSRLFRDEDLVDPATFAKECKDNHCIIVTLEYVYDFNSPTRGDHDRFMQDAKDAAAFIRKHIKGKMLKARSKIASNGRLANGIAPVGLLVQHDGENDSLVPSPHAGQVDKLYAMFREHEASLNATLNELTAMAKRGEPIFPVCDGIDEKSMFLSRVERDGKLLGWTVTSRFGLKHILTNPSYQGHLVFNQRIVKHDAFPAIVNAANWLYAFDHLADVDLDGNEIIRERKAVRYVQKTSEDKGALLAGCRHNGLPVIDGLDGSHVYYKSNTERYILRKIEGIGGYEAAISAVELDHIAEDMLLHVLSISDVLPIALKDLQETVHEVDSDKPVEEDNTLDVARNELANITRRINVAGDVMEDSELRQAYEKQHRLRKRITDLEVSKQRQEAMAAELKQAREDIKYATQMWKSWDIDRKRRLIRLVTDAITLEEIADGWLRLTLVWSPVLPIDHEQCYIWQASGTTWQEHELEVLRNLYSTATRQELLRLLPARTWHAINNRANELGLKRSVLDQGTSKRIDISENDRKVMAQYGLSQQVRIQWRVLLGTGTGISNQSGQS